MHLFRSFLGGLLAVWVGFAAGCVSPSASTDAADARRVVLTLANLTDQPWTLNFQQQPPTLYPPIESHVAPRETVTVRLAPGDYEVVQSLQEGAPGARPVERRLRLTFRAGEVFRWPLVTVLSGEAVMR